MPERFPQLDFSGGQDTLSDQTKIAADAYEWIINGRTRFSDVEPIKKPRELTTAPQGNMQGLYSLGNVLILFVSGRAYYYDKVFNTWHRIHNFLMDEDVEYIYAQAVNASTVNYVRKLALSNSNNDPIRQTYDFTVAGNPAGLVVQDGVNQPWLLQLNELINIITARPLKTYADWTNTSAAADDREYVPIGKQMMYLNGILFIVAPNGRSIYRSISGRPLDFMVNIDQNGHKLASELNGGASSVSFAADFDEITCLSQIGTEAFLIGTRRFARLALFDYDNTIFSEPRFTYPLTMEIGIVNQFSLAQTSDVIVIDFEGIKSFNPVAQLQNEARNSVLSLGVSAFLKNIRQDVCCVSKFNDYLMFAGKSTAGYGVFVYDTLLDTWQCIDITDAAKIKMFAVTTTEEDSLLYCITDDRVFQYFGSEQTAPCSIKTRSVSPASLANEHASNDFRAVFNGTNTAGIVVATELVDGERNGSNTQGIITYQRDIPIADLGVNYPVLPPVMPDNDASIVAVVFPFKNWRSGRRISYIVTWNNDAKLKELEIGTDLTAKAVSQRQSAKIYN